MSKAFSLIEVLIFISILSMFLVASASIITVSMRQNSLQISKIKAAHYNDQLFEWTRSEKELDWSNLVAKSTPSSIYCFCTEALSWTGPVSDKADCCPTLLAGIFKRSMTLSTGTYAPTGFSPTTQVEVTIYTEWQDAGNSFSAKLHTLFSSWAE